MNGRATRAADRARELFSRRFQEVASTALAFVLPGQPNPRVVAAAWLNGVAPKLGVRRRGSRIADRRPNADREPGKTARETPPPEVVSGHARSQPSGQQPADRIEISQTGSTVPIVEMTDATTREPEACPYLGLPNDPRTRFTFATPAHRCYVKRKPSQIDLGQQGAFCLTSDFPACTRYRAPAGAVASPAALAAVAAAPVLAAAPPEATSPADDFRPPAEPPPAEPTPAEPTPAELPPVAAVAATAAGLSDLPTTDQPTDEQPTDEQPTAAVDATTVVVAAAPVVRAVTKPAAKGDSTPSGATPKRPRRIRRVVRRVLLLSVVIALGALAIAAATGTLDRVLPGDLLAGARALLPAAAPGTPPAGAPPTAAAASAAARSADPSGVGSVAASAAAAPSDTPAATTPSADPGAAPSPQRTPAPRVYHVVRPGESLISIAARYGVTPQAIRRVNRLKDPNYLSIGQRLLIPPKG